MGPEARVERTSAAHAVAFGCWCLKLYPYVTGLPDRLVLIPGGRVWFVEFKAPGVSKLRPRQRIVIAGLRRLGFKVSVVSDVQVFKAALRRIMGADARPVRLKKAA